MYYYVDWQTGSDANNGTSWATAFRTFEKAFLTASGVESSGTNHIVFIRAGIYYLTTPFKTPKTNNRVLFRGMGGVLVIAGNRDCAMFFNNRNNITFVGITFGPYTLGFITNTANYANTISADSCGFHNNALFYQTPPLSSFRPRVVWAGCHLQGDFDAVLDINGTGAEGLVQSVTPIDVIGGMPLSSQGFFPSLPVFPSAFQFDAGGTSFKEPYYISPSAQEYTSGIFTNYNLAPITRQTKFGGGVWVIDPTGPEATFVFTDNDRINMTSGDNGRVLSPVYYYSAGITLRRASLGLQEFSFGGVRQVIDSTPDSSVRTIEYRISETPFTQTQASPAWITVDRSADLVGVTGKYLQWRLSFALGAVI